MRKLFTSVSGAARAIAAGAVSDDDLNTGLFFLSITSSEDIRTDEKLPPAAAAHLADAVDKALKERRCVLTLSRESYDEAKKNLYRLLNRLLALHGFAQISEDPVDERVDFRQGAVAARVQDLEVIHSRWGIGSDETMHPESEDPAGDTLK